MTDLAIYEKKVSPLATEADTLVIKSAEDMQAGVELLSRLNTTLDSIEAEEDKVLEPLKLAEKNEKARWKPFKDALKPAIDSLRKKMSVYQTEQMQKQSEAKEKIADRIGDGKGKFTQGTAMRKIGEIEAPEKKVAAESGSVSFRTDKVLEVLDSDLIPDEFWVLDEKAVLTALKSGKSIPGAKIKEVQTPINNRR